MGLKESQWCVSCQKGSRSRRALNFISLTWQSLVCLRLGDSIAFGLSERDRVIELGQGHRGGHTEHLWQESPTMWPRQLASNILLLLRLYFSASGPWELSSWTFTVLRLAEESISLASGFSIVLSPGSSCSYFMDPFMDLQLWNLLNKSTWSEISDQLLNCSVSSFSYTVKWFRLNTKVYH